MLPEWWDWDLDCANPHLRKRMIDRSFSEIDLRQMIEVAHRFRPDREPGRWVLETSRDTEPWEVIVEPQIHERVLLVVTAFAVE